MKVIVRIVIAMNYEKKYKEALERARAINNGKDVDVKAGTTTCEYIFPELEESKDEKIRKEIISFLQLPHSQFVGERKQEKWIAWLEKQCNQKPDYCHHEVDLSNCSEEYRKAYYDGWNNCNMQYSQYKSESNDVVKCLINGMKFYYEDNEEATWGTEKFSMKVKDILTWLERQAEVKESTISQHEIETCKENVNSLTYEDEKVRKALIDFFGRGAKYGGHTNGVYDKDILAWLEKQGEQKPILDFKAKDWYVSEVDGKIHNIYHSVDKVEPKFKVGDWIINPRTGLIKHIKNVLLCDNNGNYEFESSSMSIDSVDNSFHLWTIQDAKDGDVLVGSYGTFILMGKSNGGYCGVLSDNTFIRSTGNNEWTENLHPATKEQRDLLFKTMEEAGYEWDTEKKELKKIAEELQLKEGNFYECIKSYHNLGGGQYWFDKGKVYFCEKDGYLRSDPNNLIKVYNCENWQSYFRPYTEKLAWSEEDDQYVEDIIALIQRGLSCHTIGQVQEWLQSLKGRVQPQNTWKPSDEQMEALDWQVENTSVSSWQYKATKELMEDLKKLKEE